MKTPFLGSAYTSRSPNLANQRLVNAYPEIVESKSGKEVGAFYGTPGKDLIVAVGDGPIRGMFPFATTLYVVSGPEVYSLDNSFTPTLIGTVADLETPVSMIGNGAQLAIFDGSGGYVYSGGVFGAIALPFSNPGVATYQDGFGLVSEVGSVRLWQSNLNDLTTWDALNFINCDGTPDFIISVSDLHEQVVVLKARNIEMFINAGLSGFAFQRLQGVAPEIGCDAPASVAKLGQNLLWLGRSASGPGIVYTMNGYEPTRVSTHAIETAIASYSLMTDAIGFGYQQEGHDFYVLSFPSGNATWVLDLTASQAAGFNVWHERAGFTAGNFYRDRANCCALFANEIVTGDFQNGNLYAYNLSTFTNNGEVLKRLRSWRAVKESSAMSMRGDQIEIECETGIDVPDGLNPQMMLRQSFDGGLTWGTMRMASCGQSGETLKRIRFRRLGMKKRGVQTDRSFELSMTDPVLCAWLGADFT